MVGPSKILTVSYGTFSCTLEGFDDPFSTMKAIAEYFRDLAADDRYFGAEPPQPDAAMLHRIAEREVHRRVEAKVQENGVILRAGDMPLPGAAAAPSFMPFYIQPSPAVPLSESVAAKLQRLRSAAVAGPAFAAPAFAPIVEDADIAAPVAAVMPPAPEPAPPIIAAVSQQVAAEVVMPEVAMPEDAISEDVMPEAPAEHEAVAPEPVEALADVPQTADDAAAEDVPTESAAFAVGEKQGDTEPEPDMDAIAEAPAADDVIDDAVAQSMPDAFAEDQLSHAMAEVVSIGDTEEDLTADLAEAPAMEMAEAPAEGGTDDVDDALLMDSLAAALADPTPAIEAEPQDGMLSDMIDDEDDAAFLAELAAATAEPVAEDAFALDDIAPDAAPVELEDTAAQELAVATDAPAMMDPDTADQPVVAAVDMPVLEPEQAPAEAASVDETEALTNAGPAADTAEIDIEAAAMAAAESVAEVAESTVSTEKLNRARARVIKIRRADVPASEPNVLSPEAEAELAAELEALKSEAPARPQLAEIAADTSVQRLLDQTNTELEGPENRRRLDAIAHLKAAVAATVADRRATGGSDTSNDSSRMDVYRNDLERVVRPRRPASMASGTAPLGDATSPARPAPLMLVSEQRIDRPKPLPAPTAAPLNAQPASPVRPRRVAGGALAYSTQPDVDDADGDEDENLFTPTSGFAEFADRLGAQELPELLEAAVAYAACFEGRPHVSRPHMLRHVGSIMPDSEAQRDELLRSFGRLLRGGRIEKVRPGQYALPGSSRVMAEAKKLAV